MTAEPANQWTVLVPGERTERRFAVVECRACRGAEPPRHLHSREDEFIYVLEGRVTFIREGERLDGRPGSWLYLPRGSEHSFTVESDQARLLVVLAPAGLEAGLEDLDEPCDLPADPQVVERLVVTAARYGVAITGPGRRAELEPVAR